MNVKFNGASETTRSMDPPALDRTDSGDGSLGFGPMDVLSGRNKLSFNHIGNWRFREVVAQSIDDYNSAQSRAEKYGIVETIMSHIAKSGGRFLKQADDGSWEEIEPETIRQKIAHAIRDTTKKKEAKAKKALQREHAATKMSQRVFQAPATVTPASHQQSRSSNAPMDLFVQDLNKYMKKKRASTQGSSSRMSPPSAAKKPKPQTIQSGRRHSIHGMGLGMEMPHPFKNELRHEPLDDMHHVGSETSSDPGYGHRHSPPLGAESRLSYGQRMVRPASCPEPNQIYSHFQGDGTDCGLSPRLEQSGPSFVGVGLGLREQAANAPRHNSLGLGLGLSLREQMSHAPRQFSLPDLRGPQDFGLGQFGFLREIESFSGPRMGHQGVHQLEEEPFEEEEEEGPVAHDDEFMAKIDDTLGPWHPPEPESRLH